MRASKEDRQETSGSEEAGPQEAGQVGQEVAENRAPDRVPEPVVGLLLIADEVAPEVLTGRECAHEHRGS